MPGPIDTLRFVHSAIVAEAVRLEERAHGDLDEHLAASLREDVAFLGGLLDAHTKGEEVGLFPRLDEKLPHYSDGYLFDHEDERALFAELDGLLKRAAEGDEAAWPLARRELVALRCNATAHVSKENGLVLPLVCELFSPEEQVAMIQNILSTIDPASMPRIVPWIFNRVSADEAEGYARALHKAMPPEVFAKARTWIADGVEAERLADLTKRFPEVAA
jgi:hemerythrin-like domain-containing protein